MEALYDATWRPLPAALLVAAGALIALRGWRGMRAGERRPLGEPARSATWMRGFRVYLIGTALAALALGWAAHQPWLIAAALVIGGEETWESSAALFALQHAGRNRRVPKAVGRRPGGPAGGRGPFAPAGRIDYSCLVAGSGTIPATGERVAP